MITLMPFENLHKPGYESRYEDGYEYGYGCEFGFGFGYRYEYGYGYD